MLLEKISSGTPDDVPALHDHGDQQMLRFPFVFCVVIASTPDMESCFMLTL